MPSLGGGGRGGPRLPEPTGIFGNRGIPLVSIWYPVSKMVSLGWWRIFEGWFDFLNQKTYSYPGISDFYSEKKKEFKKKKDIISSPESFG
jgi:hypothetical protein